MPKESKHRVSGSPSSLALERVWMASEKLRIVPSGDGFEMDRPAKQKHNPGGFSGVPFRDDAYSRPSHLATLLNGR
jgi:hypothetical protein